MGGIIALVLEDVERELVGCGLEFSTVAAVIEGLAPVSSGPSPGRSLLFVVNDGMAGNRNDKQID